MSDWVKTGQAVPLWYEVTVTFSDGVETVVEAWHEMRFADSAEREWRRIEAEDRANGAEYSITSLTVEPKYTPMHS